jgi:transcriptional regulator with XRE-family HTH domain
VKASFAVLLRAHRVQRELTQEQLTQRARITAKGVGALERGERQRPYPHTVQALADALGLDPGERTALTEAIPFRTSRRSPHELLPPPPAAPIVGRDGEVADIAALLRAGEHRVITLVGSSGVGKTTLALLAASTAREHFPGG